MEVFTEVTEEVSIEVPVVVFSGSTLHRSLLRDLRENILISLPTALHRILQKSINISVTKILKQYLNCLFIEDTTSIEAFTEEFAVIPMKVFIKVYRSFSQTCPHKSPQHSLKKTPLEVSIDVSTEHPNPPTKGI